MSEQPPFTLFLSDLHLQSEKPETIKQFFHFLENETIGAESLYILGDFFEQWVGDDAMTDFHHEIISALSTLANKGIPIYFMRGNRDFLIGERFEKLSHCTLIKDPHYIDLYGKPTLLKHGDDLCTDDKRHQHYRKFAYTLWVQKIFLLLPLKIRLWVGNKLRNTSIRQNANIPSNIMDVNEHAVAKTLKAHSAELMIHGHTHRPDIHDVDCNELKAQRIVLGDWHNRRHFLKVFDSGQVEMKEQLF